MDIDLLATFLEVNRTRHFGRAAENLFLTQAAVSARIRQLEDNLGVQLFIRARNNIQLTPHGQRLISHAETMLSAWRAAREDVAAITDPVPQLLIGASSLLLNSIYPLILNPIRSHLPGWRLHTRSLDNYRLKTAIDPLDADLAFSLGTTPAPGWVAVSVASMSLQLFAASPATSFTDSGLLPCINLEWGGDFCGFYEALAREHLRELRTSASLAEAVAAAVAGEGSVYLPVPAGSELAAVTRQLHPVKDAPVFKGHLTAFYRTASPHRQLLQEMLGSNSN